MRRTSPLILGAGPAGCAAAIALAREGIAPVLMDRDPEPRDQLCGGFLSWRTADQLRTLGIDPASLGAHRVDRLALFARRREATLPLPQAAFGLSRRALDGALRQRAVAMGAQLEIDSVRGVEGMTAIGRRHSRSGDGLFIATGKHDIRGLARHRPSRDPALGLRLRLPPSRERRTWLEGRIELHLFGGGYAGMVLQEDGGANVCLAVRKSLLGRCGGEPARLLEMLCAGHPAFALRLAGDWRGQPIESIGSVPYGWIAGAGPAGHFRLGDQAAVVPSLAGEGIAMAIAGGSAAARHWLRGGAAASADYAREMARRVATPVRTAHLAWWLAESPLAAGLGVTSAGRFPLLPRLLIELTRLGPEPALAHSPAAP